MAEELPEEYDAIVVGTGFPESVVAAALSRIGFKVLHLDRNEYYSGQWSTFTFDGLLKWIEANQTEVAREERSPGGEIDLAPGDHPVPANGPAKMIHNISVVSYFRKNAKTSENTQTNSKDDPLGTPENVADKKVEGLQDEDQGSKMPPGSLEDASVKVLNVSEDMGKLSVAATGDTKHENEVQAAEVGSGISKEVGASMDNETRTDAPKESESNAAVVETPSSGDSSMQEVGSDDVEVPTVPQPPTDDAQTDRTESVFMRRARPKPKPPVGVNMTYSDLEHYWRRFNIDLAPKVLFSRGSLVEALISANISHYAEFKVVSRILTWMNGQVEGVPCSRADVFSSKIISVVEKRVLMKFLTFCLDYEQSPEQWEAFATKPYLEFLESRRLSPNLQHFVLHAIAMVKSDTPTSDGLRATQAFLQSLNRYGNTPFIWPLYGAGELPQAFCRMCAVFGGLYCLRRGVSAVVVNQDTNKCTGVISEGQYLKCKYVISEFSNLPDEWSKAPSQSVSRAVFLTDKSVKPEEEEFITLMSMPPSSRDGEPIRVIELGPSSMACPAGLYVVHFVSKATSTAEEDLKGAARELFHFPLTEADFESNKPIVLWSLFFNQSAPDSACVGDLPANVHFTTLPGLSLGFEEAMKQAKQIFESICPGEEFLPAIPNPEDIIRDDFLQNNEQSAGNGHGTVENQFQEAGAAEGEESANSQEHNEQSAAAATVVNPGQSQRVDAADSPAEQQSTAHDVAVNVERLESAESSNLQAGDQLSVTDTQPDK